MLKRLMEVDLTLHCKEKTKNIMVARILFGLFALFFVLNTGQSQNDIQWLSFDKALEEAESTPRKILIKIYADECSWCRRMDEETFKSVEVSSFVDDHFYPVELNVAYKEDITFQEETYQYVKRRSQSYHELAAKFMKGEMGYPAVVFLDEELNVIQCVSGYKSTVEFKKIMGYFAHNYHKRMSWSEYHSTVAVELVKD